MTPEQIERFNDQGCLRLIGFHPKKAMARLRQQVLDEIQRLSGGKGMPKALHGMPVFQQIGKLSGMVKVCGLHDILVTPALIGHITQLNGGRAPVASSIQPTQLLLSPPRQDSKTQGLNWHVDVKGNATGQCPGIQAFFLIDEVQPQGGATHALAGSHQLYSRPPAILATLRSLLNTATAHDLPGQLAPLGLNLVEMSGQAGDVVLMDMRVLHTPSVNTTHSTRMMATTRCLF